MKTDKNSRTQSTSGTDTHPEQAIPDTNPTPRTRKYRVHLYWIHTEEAFLTIMAESQAEAEEKASEIESDDLSDDDLNGIGGEVEINSVTLINEGQSDE